MPFSEKLVKIIGESGQAYYQYLDISLPQANIREDTPMHHGPAVFNLLTSPRLLDAVESFIGPEIYSNPVQHVRIKPPERLVPENMRNSLTATTDWHQDQGVVLEEADNSDILTVWLPIFPATVENGCLVVVPGSHTGELLLHCKVTPRKKGLHIPDQYLGPNQVPLPMEPGDVLFMHKKTVHASLPNVSDSVRWSFDLRYNPIGQPTGRPWFPGFVARSRAHPETELHDWREWDHLWKKARSRLAQAENPQFNRWKDDDPRCA